MSLAPALLLLWLTAPSAAPPERIVALVPLGKVDPALVKLAVETLEARVACRVRVEPERELPKEAWYAPRKRWRAEKILDAIDREPPEGAWKVVGLTAAEISTTKGDIVDWRIGGLGEIGGRTCVVSTWINERRSKTRADLHKRITDLVAHEFGHTLGADHCETAGCVMRDAKGKLLESQDASTSQFCEACRKKLGDGVLKPAPATTATH